MIVIGTSGYYFTDWVGSFYPEKLGKDRWLQHYSEHFNTVEINMTYYGLPKKETVMKWVDQTPDNFTFITKLNKESTHIRKQGGEEINDLLECISPLIDSRKLKGLLAQFPASFHAGDVEKQYLSALIEKSKGIKIFAEFRHKSWDNESTVELCRNLGYGWVAVDQPNLSGLANARPAVAGKFGYVRFHGRNKTTWYNPKAGDRYDWSYSDKELHEWTPRIKSMAQRAETTYLFFNNCHAGQAIKSAMRLKQLLKNQFEVF
ncbi:MAG: DUF72 domain-containing protein [Candidatus Electryonea clarkiae]|nr:DUF72 domain-containing protein [Candidatus Electryonea clarkiae]